MSQMERVYKIVPSHSLRNIENIPGFLETIFKPYITSLKNEKSTDVFYDDEDYKSVDFSVKSQSIPHKKYTKILYNFAELLRLYNNGVGLVQIQNRYLVMIENYKPDDLRKVITYSVEIFYNLYTDGYIIIMVSIENIGFEFFPGYTKTLFETDYCNIYNKDIIEQILNCYTYDQFIKAIKGNRNGRRNRIFYLLPDILRIVYSYVIA